MPLALLGSVRFIRHPETDETLFRSNRSSIVALPLYKSLRRIYLSNETKLLRKKPSSAAAAAAWGFALYVYSSFVFMFLSLFRTALRCTRCGLSSWHTVVSLTVGRERERERGEQRRRKNRETFPSIQLITWTNFAQLISTVFHSVTTIARGGLASTIKGKYFFSSITCYFFVGFDHSRKKKMKETWNVHKVLMQLAALQSSSS